ncbi:MAG: PDZ domain-containing protein [Planctomycetota bacterium]|nr:PDZ domain-containing protein [Planctomycetota bacterium]
MQYLPIPLLALALLLFGLPEAPVQADEPTGSLLEALNKEAAEIVSRSDATRVEIRRGQHRYRGVLVGNPPRVVAPYLGDKTGPSIFVRLPDGREYGSSIVDGDVELGISVCVVPEAWAAKLDGLALAPGEGIKRGALGVLAGEAPALALIRRVDAHRGRFLTDVRQDASALLGPRGKLLGLRGVMGPAHDCSVCHTAPQHGTASLWVDSWKGAMVEYIAHPTLKSRTNAKGKVEYYVTDGKGRPMKVAGNRLVLEGALRPHPTAAATWAHPRNPAIHANDYVSASVIRRVLEDIDAHGSIQRGYLGVVPGRADTKKKGVRISSVLAESPAAKAGIQAGDVVTQLDDVPCTSPAVFTVILAHKRPGASVRVTVAGREPVDVALADRADEMKALLTAAQLGLKVRALDDSLREWLGVPAGTQGVLVLGAGGAVVKNAGLRRGDVLLEIDEKPVRDLAELDAALATAKEGVRVTIQRGAKRTQLFVSPLPKPSSRAAPR